MTAKPIDPEELRQMRELAKEGNRWAIKAIRSYERMLETRPDTKQSRHHKRSANRHIDRALGRYMPPKPKPEP